MIEDWIDSLARVWEVDDGRGGQVKSYRLFERDEFPEDIPLDRPTALTFFDDVEIEYSLSGPNLGYWSGTAEFNLTPDLSRARMASVLKFIPRIVAAAAGNMTLGGRVSHFVIGNIRLMALQYGNKAPHLGLEVKWSVKENLEITVSA